MALIKSKLRFASFTVSMVIVVSLSTNPYAQTKVCSSSRVHHPLTGEHMVFSKVFNPQKKRIEFHSSGSIHSIKEMDSLIEIKRQQEFCRYGRVGKLLEKYIDQPHLFPDTGIKVNIYLKYPSHKQLDPFKHSEEEMIEQSRKIADMKPEFSVEEIQKKYGIGSQEIEAVGEGFLQLRINWQKLEMLRKETGIISIEMYSEPKPLALSSYAPLDYRLIAQSAFNPGPLPEGCRGEGVSIATAENGVFEYTWDCLGVNNLQVFPPNIGASDPSHSTATFATLVYASPGAKHYNFSGFDFWDKLTANGKQHCISKKIKALSISYNGLQSSTTCINCVLLDEFVNEYPYTLFCLPSGNDGSNASTSWYCYNHLHVGSSVQINLSRFEPAGFTSTKNLPAIYNTSAVSDRELPQVLAPGASPIPEGWYDNCLGFNPGAGTSYSAPVTCGITADIISASKLSANGRNFLYFNMVPEVLRAVFMLTAQDCDGVPYQVNDYDGKDGTGTISATEAIRFAKYSEYSPLNTNDPKITGYRFNSWYPWDTLPLKIPVRIPDTNPGNNRKLRIVLTWNSVANSDTTPLINEISDLDLYWDNYGHYHSSTTFDNNVELVEIPWEHVVSGSVCSLTVYPHRLRFDTRAKNLWFKYAIVWDWVKTTAEVTPEPAEPPALESYLDTTPKPPILLFPRTNNIMELNDIFSWFGGSFAKAYKINIRTNWGWNYSKIIKPHNKLSTTALVYQMGDQYYWKIATASGSNLYWSDEVPFSSRGIHQNPKNNCDHVPIDSYLEWEKVVGADSFRVEVYGDNFYYEKTGLPPSATSLSLPFLNYFTNYRWHVGVENMGTLTWNIEWTFRTAHMFILPLNGESRISTTPLFRWGPVPEAVSYSLSYWLESSNPDTFTIPNITATAYTLSTPLQYDTRYFWHVRPVFSVPSHQYPEMPPFNFKTLNPNEVPVSRVVQIILFCIIMTTSLFTLYRRLFFPQQKKIDVRENNFTNI